MSEIQKAADLLFGLVALRDGRIDAPALAEALRAVEADPSVHLPDRLERSGAIDTATRKAIERTLADEAARHGGDLAAALSHALASTLPRAFGGATVDTATPTMTGISLGTKGPALLHSLPGESSGGRYSLGKLHSRGGLGQVWLARDGTLGRDVAFKEIRPEHAEHPEILARFLREARITGRLEHPGVVPVYELSRRPDSGQPFYTMRFIRGRTLREAIADYHAKRARGEATPLELSTLLAAFVGVANTMAYAHANGVIHRDLKGENVVVGDYGEVIVLDWGLAKAVDEKEEASAGPATRTEGTVVGQVMGTPSFMSPEQAAGRTDAIGAPSDVYSLGAILFEILTGRTPVTGIDMDDVVRRAATEVRPRARSIEPNTPRPLDAILAKALSLDPAERYPNAGEIAADVRRYLADEPVSAWQEPWTVRAGRWARHHKPLVAGAGALLATAVLLLSVGTILLGQKNREIERARATAEENFQLAKHAVDAYLTRVADSPDLRAKGLEALRTNLFQSAQEFYESFVKQRSNDLASRADLGSAHVNLGNISRATGDTKRAEEAYGKAIAIYEDLAKTTGKERNNRLLSVANLGLLYSETGRPKEAEATFHRAIEMYVATPAPDEEPAYSMTASNAYDNLGTLYLNQRNLAECEKAHLRSLELRERLMKEHPDDEVIRGLVVQVHGNLSSLYASTGKENEAEAHLVAAIEIAEPLARAHPDDPEQQKNLAALLNNLGGTYTLTGRIADARAVHLRALAIREKLASAHPTVIEYRLYLAGSYVNVGELFIRDGRFQEGIESLEKADGVLAGILEKEPRHTAARFYTAYEASWRARGFDALRRFPEGMLAWQRAASFNDGGYPTIPAGFARALALRGDFVRALPQAQAMEAVPGLPPDAVYDIAAVYSMAAARDRTKHDAYAAHAVELLQKASGMGFFTTPGATDAALRDPDLLPLRRLEGFRKAVGATE